VFLDEKSKRIGELDFVSGAGFRAFEAIEDCRRQNVAASNGKIRRCILRLWFFDEVADTQEAFAEGRFRRGIGIHNAVELSLVFGDLLDGDGTDASGFVNVDELFGGGIFTRDEDVAEKNGERFVTDEIAGDQYGVAEAERLLLARVADLQHVADLADHFRLIFLAVLFEKTLQRGRGVEMVLDGILAFAGDDDDLLDSGGNALFGDVLNLGLVDDGEHLFGLRFGGRKETRAEARGREDGFADARFRGRRRLRCIWRVHWHVQWRSVPQRRFGGSLVHSSREGLILSTKARLRFCGNDTGDLPRVRNPDLVAWIAGESFRKDVGNRGGGCRNFAAVILAEETGESRSELRLRDSADVGSLAKRLRIRADNRNPDIFGAFLFSAVVLPLDESAAASMIRRDDKRGLIAIRGERLHGVPELLNEIVNFINAMEHKIVAAGMRPVVGFAVTDKQDFGLVGADVVEQGDLLEGIVDVFFVEPCRVKVEIVDESLSRVGRSAIGQVPSDLDGQMASIDIENVFESAPCSEDGELVVEFRLFVKPFENSGVRVGAELIGVDFRIRGTGEHLVVARIGKSHAVGDASNAAFGLVANDLALLSYDSPKKGEQSFSAVIDVVAPEFALQAFGPTPDSAVFGIEK
jgi:hypothetical protein